MTRRWAAIALFVPLAACALLTNLDGLAGAGDGAADALASDAADASTAAFSCNDVDASFCEDFDDEDGSTFSRWPSGYVANGGTLERVASDASPPFAVQFATPAADGGPLPFSFMTHPFNQAATTSARFSLTMRVDKYPSAPSSFFTGTSVSLDGQSSVSMILSSKSAALQESVAGDAGTTYPTIPLGGVIPLGKWVNVDMTFNLSSSPITLEVRFDGATVLAPTALDPGLKAGIPSITLGETYVDPASDGMVLLDDNVVFDFQ